MKIMPETLCKTKILANGVIFSEKALLFALEQNAKIQNLVYNKPYGVSNTRPQELLIKGPDNYETVVSCVVPHNRFPIMIDYKNGTLIASENGNPIEGIQLAFVEAPSYYKKQLQNGECVKNYVSTCGYDELNIFPWKGCAISKGCLFCGVNSIIQKKDDSDVFTAFKIGKEDIWQMVKQQYLNNLKEAINIAKKDSCFMKHMHVILISGDLPNEELDIQSLIYSDISEAIFPIVNDKATEGVVAVMMPPNNLNLINRLKESMVEKLVFNLEVGNEPYFSKYCPGKADIGLAHINKALDKAVEIYGAGNVWSNFVFGLEPLDKALNICENLAERGIVPSANVLHIDSGNRLDCDVPQEKEILEYYYNISEIYKQNGFSPYYCAKALRTSLTNEAFEGRIKE